MVVVVEVSGGEEGDGSVSGRQYVERGTRTVRVLRHTTECDACVRGCDESRVTEKRKKVSAAAAQLNSLFILFAKTLQKKTRRTKVNDVKRNEQRVAVT